MKVLVIGYGSMGRRRIRLLKKLCNEIKILCVDSSNERRRQAESEGYISFHSIEEALAEQYDCAFICTSPGHHADLILLLIEKKINVFTELNLVSDRYDEIIQKSEEKKVKVFMSSTMLYNKQIQSIQSIVSSTDKTLNYIFHVGQYLPDWYPWESYKDYFVANKETNGCREIMAIQLPWIYKTFGEINSFSVLKKDSTELDIEYDDTYYLQLYHKNKCFGTFICDVVSRRATSHLEIFNEDIFITWEGTPESLYSFNKTTGEMEKVSSYNSAIHIDGYADNIIEDDYEDEVAAFLSWIYEDITPLYMIQDDKYIISVINQIEERE